MPTGAPQAVPALRAPENKGDSSTNECATLNIVAEMSMDAKNKCHANSGIIFPLFLQK